MSEDGQAIRVQSYVAAMIKTTQAVSKRRNERVCKRGEVNAAEWYSLHLRD